LLGQTNQKESEIDLLDVIDLNNFDELEVDAYDIGDEEKYVDELRVVEKPVRSFNKIEVKETSVIKTCCDEKIKYAEENWYKELSEKADFILKPISYDPLVLPRVFGEQNYYRTKELYSIAKEINKLKDPIEPNVEDCFDMYIHKTIKRIQDVEFLFPFKSEFYVNGIKCYNPVDLLKQINIDDLIPDKFYPIHGDLTSSNVLWENEKPIVIDPRGLFGKTLLYGDKDYDIAKIYYSETGWHLLNKGNLVSKVLSENSFEVQQVVLYGDKKIDFLLSIIWLSVAQYVKNNVLSSMYAYLFGSLLLTETYNRYFLKESGNG
jgi:hypothetical protein